MDFRGNEDIERKERAKKRMEEIKAFYIHLMVYVLVNLFITITKITQEVQDGKGILDVIMDFSTFAVWLFWGIGLAVHALNVFSLNPFFNKEWEQRKIQQFMNEDAKESKKYR